MCAVFSGAGQMWSREKCDELAKEVVEQFDRVPVEIITTASGLMGEMKQPSWCEVVHTWNKRCEDPNLFRHSTFSGKDWII